MEDKINSINMNEKLNHKEIYNLFKTYSSKINKEISEKIHIFEHNMDFFKFYSNKDFINLLNIFELKLFENNDEFFSSYKSNIDVYISCISQIILSIKLFLKTQDVLSKNFVNVKKQLSKLKNENKLENYNQDYLLLCLESLLKNSEKIPKFYSSDLTLLSSDFSSIENSPQSSLFQKFSSENKINDFSNAEIEPIIYDSPPTPRFESDKELEIQKDKISNLDSVENNSLIKNNSILTLSEYIFDEEPIIHQKIEPKLIKSKTKTPTKIRTPHIENINDHKNKRNTFSKSRFIVKNNKKNHCKNLLEMIKKIYKKGLINSEEKVELKQLVIEKSKKIEYFYYNIYKHSKNDKNKLVFEVKKIVN